MSDYSRYGIEKKLKPRTGTRMVRMVFFAFLKLLVLIMMVVIIGGGIYIFNRWNSLVESAPDISGVTFTPGESATYIYDRDGKRVQKLTLPEANRDLVTLKDVPEDLQHAVVAIEDSRFYEHYGVDPKGIVRALILGLKSGSFSQGASTITQQLLKNSVFPGWTKETTFAQRIERKIQEQYLALKLEKIQTKDQILENYLNLINLGAGCYGVQAAAYRYFGKNVSDLTLSEAAVIAGITQNPTAYNPIIYPENNEKRRKMVLDAMLDQGYIDQGRYEEALSDDVYDRIRNNVSAVDTTNSIYTFYQDALIDQVMRDLQNELAYTYQQAYRAVYSGGLRIYSAQDDQVQAVCDEEMANSANFPAGTKVGIDYALSVQDADLTVTDFGNEDLRKWVRSTSDPSFNLMYDSAETAQAAAQGFRASVVREGDTVLGERVTITPQPQASCVVIDQSTGLVAALVGGRGTKEASLTLNRASYTTRQPGSTFKIITTYAPAIENRTVTLASTIVDEPYNYEFGTAVNNAGGEYQGEVTIRKAIAESINVVAVKLLTQITPQAGYDMAKKFGIRTLTDHLETDAGILTDVGQTLALGGISRGVTNLQLTGAYAAIANLGHYYEPKFYIRVLDQYGNVILDNSELKSRTVISESTAQILTSAMEDVIRDERGTAHGLIDLGEMSVAGKTGTTNDWRDSWFVGYTPYYTCGVWTGFDNNEVLPDEDTYHTFSKTLWNSIMNRIHISKKPEAFRQTGDVTWERICRTSHRAASPGCPDSYEEIFAQGTQPQYYCDVHWDGSSVLGERVSPGSTQAITILNQDQVTIGGQPDAADSGSGVYDLESLPQEDISGEADIYWRDPADSAASQDSGTAQDGYSEGGAAQSITIWNTDSYSDPAASGGTGLQGEVSQENDALATASQGADWSADPGTGSAAAVPEAAAQGTSQDLGSSDAAASGQDAIVILN